MRPPSPSTLLNNGGEETGLTLRLASIVILPPPHRNGLAKVPVKTYPSGIGVVLQNLITSVSDVSLADSFAAHMLGREDRYYRFCPTADVFNCDMGISDEAVLSKIRSESKAYMANPSVRAKLVDLAKILAGPRT